MKIKSEHFTIPAGQTVNINGKDYILSENTVVCPSAISGFISVEDLSAQKLLVGREIVGVDDDHSDQIILMLDDNTNVTIKASTIYLPQAGDLPVLEFNPKIIIDPGS